MAVAFEEFVTRRRDLGGLISAGGSGGTALATRAMRRLPIGVPKVMVSTVASGDVRPYVGPSDICMMYSVTDVSGINRISEKVLANAAHALAGMLAFSRPPSSAEGQGKPALGLTMFGLTTPCVQAVCKQLETDYDCLVFHATGTGGQTMEKLTDSGLLAGVLDITTTEVADEVVGGVLTAGPSRLDVFARAGIPYVGSCGALDMVNFWARSTVPAPFKDRTLHVHNPNVTLMRTTADEATRIGRFNVDKRNRMAGRGSLAGLLAYGNANEIVVEMAHEVLPVVQHTPVLAGVNGTDPFLLVDSFLRRLGELGFSGIQNFPTVGLFDGVIRAQLEETGMGYALEVQLIERARKLDLLTTPYVFSEQNARDMAGAGADIVVCHLGLTTGGAIGARTALRREDCVALIDSWAAAARAVNPDVLVLCHGGPIATPEDAAYVLKTARNCNGFYGASSMERLPTETALTETTRMFKRIGTRRKENES